MTDRYLAAVVQLSSGEDKEANLAAASSLIEQAAGRGAELVALPELFNCLGRPDEIVRQAESIPGPTSEAMSALAARLGITLLAGSMAERDEGTGRAFNTSVLFGPDGKQLAAYRKLHLFDIDLPGRVTFRESSWLRAGDEVVAVPTPLGTLGLAICYDLRFAELFRVLSDRGADVLLVPSAFTQATGCDHWQVLLQARAIENQAFVIAPNQHGIHSPQLVTYGRSMIIDPWGTVLATAGDGAGIALAEIRRERLVEVRRRLPALKHRRLSTAQVEISGAAQG